MNLRYEAIISLGRSITSIDKGDWATGTIGGFGKPKCAVGLVTRHVLGRPLFLSMCETFSPRRFPTIELAVDALRQSVSQEAYDRALTRTHRFVAEGRLGTNVLAHMEAAYHGLGGIEDTQTLLVCVNDASSAQQVREWFSDAIDVLAEELPVPASPVISEAVYAL